MIEGIRAKNFVAIILFVDFSKIFDSIHRGKMKLIKLAYVLLKESVTAITMLYKNMKAIARSHDDNTDFFDIVSGIL